MRVRNNPRIIFAFDPAVAAEHPDGHLAGSLRLEIPTAHITFIRFGSHRERREVPRKQLGSSFDMTLDSLLSRPVNMRSLRLLGEFKADAGFERFRFLALKLLNRKDLTGTFRFLDREVLLAGALAGVMTFLDERKVDLVVFDVTPHEFTQFVLWSVLQWMGTQVLFFQPSPIAPAMLARTNLATTFAPKQAVVSRSTVCANILATATQSIDVLLEGLDPSYMKTYHQRDRRVMNPLHKLIALRASIGWLFKDRFPESIDFSGHGHRQGIFTRALKIFLARSLSRTMRKAVFSLKPKGELSEKYCVFALHYEPERTSLPEGLPIDFQADGVAAARSIIPEALTLVVKEHYSQQTSGLRGFAGRSPNFYRLVDNFPNTVFADTRERLSELVGQAQCVFTLTGTVAIEAVLKGVPVAYFGNPWWGGLPGTKRLDQLTLFEDVVDQEMPDKDEVVSFLLDLTLHRMIPGIASASAESIEKILGPLPAGFAAEEARSITACISKVLRQ